MENLITINGYELVATFMLGLASSIFWQIILMFVDRFTCKTYGLWQEYKKNKNNKE